MEYDRRSVIGAFSGMGIANGFDTEKVFQTDEQVKHSPRDGIDLFVDPDRGDDSNAGGIPTPTGDDGPLETLDTAMSRAPDRAKKIDGDRLTIWLRGGRYERSTPVEIPLLEPDVQLTVAAYPGEDPIVSGGREISEWEQVEINGTTAWRSEIPEASRGEWYFRQLFVDGDRRRRPTLPKEGFYEWEGIPDEAERGLRSHNDVFRYDQGQIDPTWDNLEDVEVVIPHIWLTEQSPIHGVDSEDQTVELELASDLGIETGAWYSPEKYYVENVKEALSDPGEWYLDREEGAVYYIPTSEETPQNTRVVAPVTTQLLVFDGDWSGENFIEDVVVSGITFRHTRSVFPGIETDWNDRIDQQGQSLAGIAATQSMYSGPGTIEMRGCKRCSIEDCTLEHTGFYGIDLDFGCHNNRLVGNELRDLGAGGVKQSGGRIKSQQIKAIDETEPPKSRTRNTFITDNHVHDGGNMFHEGAGILSRHASNTTIAHNEIHGFHHNGISVGWTWLYQESVEKENRIEQNHIYDIGRTFHDEYLTEDKGAIYTLGEQPGTTIRGNVIHDIEGTDLSQGIYLDASSSHMLVANNLIYRVLDEAIHMHYGYDNVIRNNVCVDARAALFGYSNKKLPSGVNTAAKLRHNIFVTDGKPIVRGGYNWSVDESGVESDRNLLWDQGGSDIYFGIEFDPSRRVHGPVNLRYREQSQDDASVSPLVTDIESTGRQRNNYDDFIGTQLTIGPNPLTITHLGLYKVAGASDTHDVKLVSATTGEDVEGATVSVDLSTGTSGDFVYEPLDNPVTLAGNTTYYLVAKQDGGGDPWFNAGDTVVSSSDAASVDGPVYYAGGEVNEWVSRATQRLDLQGWREMGRDSNSIVADPQFQTMNADDFSLHPESPAERIGFEPIDVETAGVRNDSLIGNSLPQRTGSETATPRTPRTAGTDRPNPTPAPEKTTSRAPLNPTTPVVALLIATIVRHIRRQRDRGPLE
jgi:hypothetical protein